MVSIPNGLFKSFRPRHGGGGGHWYHEFQSQTGFSSHSDLTMLIAIPATVNAFQSQTGFSSHSDLPGAIWILAAPARFNPKRAFQVIPTTNREMDIWMSMRFQSQTGFSSHSDRDPPHRCRHDRKGFQSQTGFSSHSDHTECVVAFCMSKRFQSQTGFSSHSDTAYSDAGDYLQISFNPKRAFQVIPTEAGVPCTYLAEIVSIPNGLFKSFRHGTTQFTVRDDTGVSIPNGLFKSFRHLGLGFLVLFGAIVSIPNGLFKSFRR